MNEISFVAWNKATVDDDDEGESQPKVVETKRLAAAAGCSVIKSGCVGWWSF